MLVVGGRAHKVRQPAFYVVREEQSKKRGKPARKLRGVGLTPPNHDLPALGSAPPSSLYFGGLDLLAFETLPPTVYAIFCLFPTFCFAFCGFPMVTRLFVFGISGYFILFFQFLLSALPSARFRFLFAPLATAGVSLQHFSAFTTYYEFCFQLVASRPSPKWISHASPRPLRYISTTFTV